MQHLDDLVGRTDLLQLARGVTAKQQQLDLSPLLSQAGIATDAAHTCQVERNQPYDQAPMNQRMLRAMETAIASGNGGQFSFNITNCDRSVGAGISGVIAKKYGKGLISEDIIKGIPAALKRLKDGRLIKKRTGKKSPNFYKKI